MVCVPCFIIPVLLYIWHKFFQPIFLPILQRYWNPWEKKDADGNVIKAGPEFPFECTGGSCPYKPSGNKNNKKTIKTPEKKRSADAIDFNSGEQVAVAPLTRDWIDSDIKKYN